MLSVAHIVLSIFFLASCSTGQFLFYTGSVRKVFGQKGLSDALSDASVDRVRISGKVLLDPSNWTNSGVINNRQIVIEGDPDNSTHILDFGGVFSALVFGSGSSITFNNLTLEGAGPQTLTPDQTNDPGNLNVTARVLSLGSWPSLILLNGSAVTFNNTRLQYYSQQNWSRCSTFSQKVLFQLQESGIANNLSLSNDVTLRLDGSFSSLVNVTDYFTMQTVGRVNLTTINTTMTCVNDPWLQDQAVSGIPPPSPHGGGFKWWYGLIIAVVVAALAMIAILGIFVLLARRRNKRKAALNPSPVTSSKSPQSQGPMLTDSASIRSTYSTPHDGTSRTHITADSISAAAVVGGLRSLSPKVSHFGSHNSHVSNSSGGTHTPTTNLGRIASWGEIQYLLRERSDFSDLEFGPLIGKGSFGRVYKGRWKGAFVAVKIVDHKEAANKVMALREGTLSHSAQHPNVITTYNVFTQQVPAGSDAAWMQDSLVGEEREQDGEGFRAHSMDVPKRADSDLGHCSTVLILEYADRGTLDKAISTGRFINRSTGEMNLRSIHATLLDIAGGIAYLHSVGVLHGDLKGANVLLKSTTADSRGFTAKLADFGMARLLAENSTHVSTKTYGTISYMPIEVLKYGKLTRAVDSYSFAIIMWELFSGEILYADMTVAQLYYKVCCESEKPPVPPNMPLEYSRLMQQCWDDDPELRPSSEEILRYLMTLPAHRRVSKESQSLSGSFSTPGKTAPRNASGLLVSTSSREAKSSLSKALTTGRSSDAIASSGGLKGSTELTPGPAPMKQGKLALPVDLPQGLAVSAIEAEYKNSEPPPNRPQIPLSSPFSNSVSVASAQQSKEVHLSAETPSEVVRPAESPLRNPENEGRHNPTLENIAENESSGQENSLSQVSKDSILAGRPPASNSQSVNPKPPLNPFAHVSQQFIRDESSEEPFGARRLS